MKKILFVFIIIFYFSNIFASKVDTSKAYLVAKNFLNERKNSHKNFENKEIILQLISNQKSTKDLFYIFDINKSSGFIIVS
ncbi:MAG: Spi family protease inhibitor, partial [Bacteroidota bacterium]|nr:Spi family protease inhibitor [Bacteroidota bacterium]